MIRHRFIVRGLDDFRIFAAIPVETKVLTWEKWVRPPDWAELASLCELAFRYTRDVHLAFADIALAMEDALTRVLDDDFIRANARFASRDEMRDELTDHKLWAVGGADRALNSCEQFVEWIRIIQTRDQTVTDKHFRDSADAIAFHLDAPLDPHSTLPRLQDTYTYRKKEAESVRVEEENKGRVVWAREHCRRVLCRVAEITAAGIVRKEVSHPVANLISSDPLPDTPCPPGVPFAAYTIEFKDAVFSVVEGKAWVSSRPLPPVSVEEEAKLRRQAVREINALQAEADAAGEFKERRVLADFGDHRRALRDNPAPPTDEEKRVVEIVTQMLVERGLNPKAPERIPVTEVDPGHANHVREAETRDIRDGRAPKVRTIKFNVTPPRYLREAVERIHASPGKHKKAHWVIGHWRNQPYGAGRHEHRRTWIKPHIRGLGEAGAVVVRVAAADETVATLPDQPTPPGGQA